MKKGDIMPLEFHYSERRRLNSMNLQNSAGDTAPDISWGFKFSKGEIFFLIMACWNSIPTVSIALVTL